MFLVKNNRGKESVLSSALPVRPCFMLKCPSTRCVTALKKAGHGNAVHVLTFLSEFVPPWTDYLHGSVLFCKG